MVHEVLDLFFFLLLRVACGFFEMLSTFSVVLFRIIQNNQTFTDLNAVCILNSNFSEKGKPCVRLDGGEESERL